MQEQVSQCNLPSCFNSTKPTVAILRFVEGLGSKQITAAEVQFNLLCLVMASLCRCARRRTTQPFLPRGLASGCTIHHAQYAGGQTKQWWILPSPCLGTQFLGYVYEATSLSTMLTEFKQSFVSAPFAKDLLFDRKPILAVVYETEQDSKSLP